MKYLVTLTYNNCSLGSNFYMLKEKESKVSQKIDHTCIVSRLHFVKVERYPTSVHPQTGGILLCFTLRIETSSMTYLQVGDMFDIDPDIVVEVNQEE